jgi:hypothetical protein
MNVPDFSNSELYIHDFPLPSLKIQNPDLHLSGASGFMGALGPFPFLFPSPVKKRTVETEFWDNFIILHAGDVNQNGGILLLTFDR